MNSKSRKVSNQIEVSPQWVFHRNEWTILGAPPADINDFCVRIASGLENYKVGYLGVNSKRKTSKKIYQTELLIKKDYQLLNLHKQSADLQYRRYFNDLDLLLINGETRIGKQQIIINNAESQENLASKSEQLDDIRMILLERSSDDIPSFVIEKIKDNKDVQIFRLDQTQKIIAAILSDYAEQIPPLYGLVLAGGKSQRMGTDKGAIEYHGKAQREYEADLLKPLTYRTFISCRKNQDELIETAYEKVYDTFTDLGPYGGLLSAFRAHPQSAWLTLSCDLPYLDKSSLDLLIRERDASKLATCFLNPDTKQPEPLLTIWEPRAYSVLLEYLGQGCSSPKKVLSQSDVKTIETSDTSFLRNANNSEDSKEALLIIASS